MRSMAKGADIVFMPYNYVIDESIRYGLNDIFDNAVIIFDEAHNVISVGEESQSFNIKREAYLTICNLINTTQIHRFKLHLV